MSDSYLLTLLVSHVPLFSVATFTVSNKNNALHVKILNTLLGELGGMVHWVNCLEYKKHLFTSVSCGTKSIETNYTLITLSFPVILRLHIPDRPLITSVLIMENSSLDLL